MSTNTDNTKIMGSEYFLKDNALKYTDPTFVFPTLAPKLQSLPIYRIFKLPDTCPRELKSSDYLVSPQ
ncbi:MAG: hypothetical protein MK088_18805 [Alteromonas sp.]|nr:hypothetical protein [Alteromonas sp.]